MGRPTKIRDAKSAQDFRDAVVEKWKEIRRKVRPVPEPEYTDQPALPRVLPQRDLGSSRGFGRRSFFDDDE